MNNWYSYFIVEKKKTPVKTNETDKQEMSMLIVYLITKYLSAVLVYSSSSFFNLHYKI